jgi:hypothetical protein
LVPAADLLPAADFVAVLSRITLDVSFIPAGRQVVRDDGLWRDRNVNSTIRPVV